MKKRVCVVTWSLTLLMASAAFAWTPAECDPALARQWADYAQRMRDAEPGSPIYAPKPFPKTDKDVVEDLRYGYLKMWSHNDFSKHPPEAKLVYDGLQSGTLKLTIDRIENWSVTRCSSHRPRSFVYFVRIFGADGETELGRATVNEDGLLGSWQYRPPDEPTRERWLGVLRSPESTRAEVAERLGLQTSNAQLVQTSGTLRCPLLEPCVALRSQGHAYLVNKQGEVFEVADEGVRFSRREAMHPTSRASVVESVRERGERLVSVGGEFAVAKRVGQVASKDPVARPKD